MSLIYGYNDEREDNSNDGNVSDLEKLVGKKTDNRTVDTAFGRIKDNKKNISNSIISTANVVASVVSSLGQKTDDKTVDSAFGKIKKNKKDIQTSNTLVGSSSSVEGESTLKGTQLSHASAITAHAHNLLELETNLGSKTDDKTADSAFGRIQKKKENIENFQGGTGLKETTGTFIAPLNDGKVEITGWTMTQYSTIIAIIIKAEQNLRGVHWVTLHSGTSSSNNDYTITFLMNLTNMKIGSSAILLNTRDPGHPKMYANTKGNAVGSVASRTVKVKFVYIDHTTPSLN